jgi:hypothetical protein
MPKMYQLTLSAKQLGTIQHALDMFFRVGMGQMREVCEHMIDHKLPIDEWCDRRDRVNDILSAAKSVARPELSVNAFHGINSTAIDDANRIASDIHNVIRHHVVMENNPGGWTVAHNEPRARSEEPLPAIRTVEEE